MRTLWPPTLVNELPQRQFDPLVYGWLPCLVGNPTLPCKGKPTMAGSMNFTRCEASPANPVHANEEEGEFDHVC